jgi:hypothetical protein
MTPRVRALLFGDMIMATVTQKYSPPAQEAILGFARGKPFNLCDGRMT